MTRTRIKICGITRPEDARAAAEAGADAVGFVLAPSPRRADRGRAAALAEAAGPARRVGVFVDASREEIVEAAECFGLHLAQLCGDETEALAVGLPLPVIRAVQLGSRADLERASTYPAAAFLLDAPRRGTLRGGTGRGFDPAMADDLPWPRDRTVVAGGLTAANVEAAILHLRPGAVDVSSGVESSPGVKDAARMRAFVAAVRRADRILDGREPFPSPFGP
jgi:phosphoribosylanthranilate isomerase